MNLVNRQHLTHRHSTDADAQAAGLQPVAAPANSSIRCKIFARLSNIELYQLLQLRSAVFVLEQQCLYQDIDDLDLHALHVLVSQNNRLLAYGRLLQPDSTQRTVRMGRIVIAAALRGGGHGRWLICLLRACASRQWPDCAIELSAQTHLQQLYASCGFDTISKPYDEDGISHVDMRWQR